MIEQPANAFGAPASIFQLERKFYNGAANRFADGAMNGEAEFECRDRT